MKKILVLLLALLLALAVAGCGSDEGDDEGGTSAPDKVTIGEYEIPVYPGSATESETGMSASYKTSDGPDKVQAWYDENMIEDGWQANQDWYDMGEQKQRVFFQGQPLENPDFGDKNVIIGVAPNEGGGSLITIAPILNRYQG